MTMTRVRMVLFFSGLCGRFAGRPPRIRRGGGRLHTRARPRGRGRLAVLAALVPLVLFVSVQLAAHDFWIAPAQFHASAGSPLTLALRVGQDFPGDPVPRQARLIERFIVRGPDGERAVEGREGQDPAGLVALSAPGLYVVGYRSLPSSVELGAEAFEKYLVEEGLEPIIEQRKKAGRSQAPGLEIFSRCAKALVLAQPAAHRGGAPTLAGFDRSLGFRLELIPETNPYDASRRLQRFRLDYEGRPLAGALVVAIAQDGRVERQSARSDRAGRVQLALSSGVWLVKAVHMVPAPRGVAAEWESLWASLTFERPPVSADPRPRASGARKSGAGARRSDPAFPAARARR